MPYFIDEKNCVRKGTKDEPGEVVGSCHESRNEAIAHLRALYANVEDATEKLYVEVEDEWYEFVRDKGGPGSGWHNPPEGTHTAENAPNFAGGPGADRKYGTESDEPPEGSKLCKCTKCKSQFTLPKGKQCEDVKCPGCGGTATQTEWREDKPAEGRGGRKPSPGRKKAQDTHACTCPECDKTVHVPQGQKCNEVPCPGCETAMKSPEASTGKAMDAPGPQMHGSGGALGEVASVMDDGGSGCKCPECGEGLPCTAKACPHCNATFEKVERMESDKRTTKSEGDGDHPAGHYLVVEDPEKPTTWHLRVRNAKGELDHTLMGGAWAALHGGYRGNKYQGPNKEQALAKLKRLYEQEGMSTPSEKSIVSYKSADGDWRWIALCNWAVIDKEAELITERAYRDAIEYAQKSGDWGRLDLVHVDGTECGDPDMLFLVQQGQLPPKFGAGGKWDKTEKATKARRAIQADPEHWGISLKFRFDPAQFVHGVYTGGIQILRHSILPRRMAASYGTAIAVQQGGDMSKQIDEKTAAALGALGVTEEEIAELAEKNKALPQEENVVEKEETPDAGQEKGLIEVLAAKVGQALGLNQKEQAPDASQPEEARKIEEVTPANDAVPAEEEKAADEPTVPDEAFKALGAALAEAMKAELEKRDEQIEALTEQVKALSVSVEEQVEKRLGDMPPAAHVAPSLVGATAVDAPETEQGMSYTGAMWKSITERTEKLWGPKSDKLEV